MTNKRPRYRHTIVLGGIGPDGHAVGLTILKHMLITNGFSVVYLGTHNTLPDFFRAAPLADVVFISSLDGHARQYTRDFPALRGSYGAERPLWYIGGNLSIGGADACAAEFLAMGFSRVFPKFVDVNDVLSLLERDLSESYPRHPELAQRCDSRTRLASLPPNPDPPPSGRQLVAARSAVLEQWPTGAAARDLDANATFLAGQPAYVVAQRRAQVGSRYPLVHPRSGVALAAEQRRLFLTLRESGADVLSYQVDSLTRNNDYSAAAREIRDSYARNVSALNGFPMVNHGVSVLRESAAEVAVPLQARHSTRDPRLLAEIAYAGGVTSFEGGAISYNIPYHHDLPLTESLRNWAYVDWLTGLYFRRYGIVLDREFFGVLTGTLIPPCLAIVVNLLEMTLAVQHGVRSVSLGYAEQGNRVQDIAAMRVMRSIAGALLRRLGHPRVEVFSVFHQYMAAFPADRSRAAQLIRASASTAALAGATRVLVKTPAEATGVPTVRDNITGMAETLRGIKEAADLALDEVRIAEEETIIHLEVRCLLNSVVRAGGGDLALGVVRCFHDGRLDVPFAPSVYNRGDVLTARDTNGAVRFLRTGNLPLTRQLLDFHEGKMAERRRCEGVASGEDYRLVERDVLRVPRGEYDRWPLGD